MLVDCGTIGQAAGEMRLVAACAEASPSPPSGSPRRHRPLPHLSFDPLGVYGESVREGAWGNRWRPAMISAPAPVRFADAICRSRRSIGSISRGGERLINLAGNGAEFLR